MVHIWLVTVMFHPSRKPPVTESCKDTGPMTSTPPVSGATSRIPGLRRPGQDKLPRDIKVMLAAAFLIALGFGLVAPVLPQFATTFGVGNTEAAVIVAIFALMRLVFAPAGGALIARLG